MTSQATGCQGAQGSAGCNPEAQPRSGQSLELMRGNAGLTASGCQYIMRGNMAYCVGQAVQEAAWSLAQSARGQCRQARMRGASGGAGSNCFLWSAVARRYQASQVPLHGCCVAGGCTFALEEVKGWEAKGGRAPAFGPANQHLPGSRATKSSEYIAYVSDVYIRAAIEGSGRAAKTLQAECCPLDSVQSNNVQLDCGLSGQVL
jgi:hypothetical protein